MDNILTTTESFIFVLDSRNATTYINGSFNSSLIFNIEDAIKINGIKMTFFPSKTYIRLNAKALMMSWLCITLASKIRL